MSVENKRSNEFRRYRQVLTALYLGTATAGFTLLTASVVKELFFRRPAVDLPRSSVTLDDPDPAVLLECHGRVQDLFNSLVTKTCELLALPPSGAHGELPGRIQEFARVWRDEWDVADARCRFSELADTKMGVAYDRLAHVHSDLQSMRLKYQSLLVRFDDEQAAELAAMRQALDQSRAALEEKAREAVRPGAPPRAPEPATPVEPTSPAPR